MAAETHGSTKAAIEAYQRDLIADATCAVLAREGLEAATMRRIATELGSTTGMITHHFPSKVDVMLHAMDRVTATVFEEVGKAFGTPPRSVDDLLEWSLRTLPINERLRNHWRVLLCFRTAAMGNDRIAEAFFSFRRSMAASVSIAVAAGIGRPVGDPIVERTAVLLQSLFVGLGLNAAVDDAFVDIDEIRPLYIASVHCILEQARAAG